MRFPGLYHHARLGTEGYGKERYSGIFSVTEADASREAMSLLETVGRLRPLRSPEPSANSDQHERNTCYRIAGPHPKTSVGPLEEVTSQLECHEADMNHCCSVAKECSGPGVLTNPNRPGGGCSTAIRLKNEVKL